MTEHDGRGRKGLRAVGQFVQAGSESALHGVGVIARSIGRGCASLWHGITDFPNPFN